MLPKMSSPVPQFSVKSACSSCLPLSPLQCLTIHGSTVYHAIAAFNPVSPGAACHLLSCWGLSSGPTASQQPCWLCGLWLDQACLAGHCVLLLPRAGGCSGKTIMSLGVCTRLVPGKEGAILDFLGEEIFLICCMMVSLTDCSLVPFWELYIMDKLITLQLTWCVSLLLMITQS